jgi:prepilin-type N-terminal cleavage/methylation domain-containing protein
MKNRAFTLVEMLIVIIIIGLLAVALVPKLTAIQGRARDVARKWDIQQLAVWLASYQLSNNLYPSWFWSVSQTLTGLAPVYLRSLPKDPFWNSITTTNWSQSVLWEYLYLSLESNKWYVLIAVSEWGGVNANWISDSTSTSMTGSLPGLISASDTVDTINKWLCTTVSNGILWRIGNVCTANYSLYQAKYIVATK